MNFKDMTPEQRREIATRGGRAVQAAGTGYRWDYVSAKRAAKKAVRVRRAKREERESQ